MGRIKELKPFVKIFVILIVVFFLSMTLVYCIPTSWIQNNVEKSVEVIENEGEYPMYFFYRHSAIIDEHTDKLMYTSLIQNRDYYNPVQASVSINQHLRSDYLRTGEGKLRDGKGADRCIDGSGTERQPE